jgi:hypothetical protein
MRFRATTLVAAATACATQEPPHVAQAVQLPSVASSAVVPVATALVQPPSHVDVTGKWLIAEGRAQGGSSYTGTVTISKKDAVFDIAWEISGTSYEGIGLQYANRLYVGWGSGGGMGIVVYRLRPDGSMTGEWSTYGETALGTETATGSGGHYDVAGSNPSGGGSYTGTLDVTTGADDVYHLVWTLGGTPTYEGTGLRDGAELAVGWARSDVGYVEYVFEGDTARGRWTWLGSPGIFVENLERQH